MGMTNEQFKKWLSEPLVDEFTNYCEIHKEEALDRVFADDGDLINEVCNICETEKNDGNNSTNL